MITNLEVDGYKSLNNFSISFTEGINVIVGPNGSGKTNVCQVLKILSSIPKGNLLDCLRMLGGTSSVFSKQNTKKIISITASGKRSSSYHSVEYDLRYIYQINIKIIDEVEITESLVVQRKTPQNTYRQILKIKNIKKSVTAEIVNSDFIGEKTKIIDEKTKKINFDLMGNDDCLWAIMPKLFYVCFCVGADLVNQRLINIDPNIVREPCDIIEAHMLGNGKFLANELNTLLENEEKKEEIVSLLEKSLPNFQDITVQLDSLDSKRHIVLKNVIGNFSTENLSDGTLKLIGVLVAATSKENYSLIIEEPENYLHPRVDRLLIEYLRESFAEKLCILTSHSETILNLIRPEEIIFCQNLDGSSQCNRFSNAKKIQEAIDLSGMGCGYHYVLGNLNLE